MPAKAKKTAPKKTATAKIAKTPAKSAEVVEPSMRAARRPIAGIPTGTQDVVRDQMHYWAVVEQALQSLINTYQFNKMATPIYEAKKLIVKGLGEENTVVKKKLVSLDWPNEENYALRPELRVGMARAYLQQNMGEESKPHKFYAMGPIFQYQENPDGENWNQATNINFEIYDSRNAVLDAQLIQIGWKLLHHVGLTDYRVHINSTGCEECRPGYIANLKEYYETNSAKVCRECRDYIKKNPLRVLDCQEEKCQRVKLDAPQLLDSLCQNCNEQLKGTLEYLDEIEVPYELMPSLIGEVDYFIRTVFAILPDGDQASDPDKKPAPLFTGGRYNNLIETIGGLPTFAVGITGHVERIVRAMQEQQVKLPKVRRADVYLAQLSERAKKKALEVFDELRLNGIRVIESFGKNSISKQIDQATELGVRITLILGQKETQEGTILLRDMENGVQETINLSKVVTEIKRRLQEEPLPEDAEKPEDAKEDEEPEEPESKKKKSDKKDKQKSLDI